MEKISWTDHARNEEVLLRVNDQSRWFILHNYAAMSGAINIKHVMLFRMLNMFRTFVSALPEECVQVSNMPAFCTFFILLLLLLFLQVVAQICCFILIV